MFCSKYFLYLGFSSKLFINTCKAENKTSQSSSGYSYQKLANKDELGNKYESIEMSDPSDENDQCKFKISIKFIDSLVLKSLSFFLNIVNS